MSGVGVAKRKKQRGRKTTRRRKVAKHATAAATRANRPLRKVVLHNRTPPGPDYQRVCAVAKKLPGVEESTSYGTPSLKVKGRMLARLRSEEEGALVVRCDLLDQQILLQADPNVFFITDHYVGYPLILVRLDRVRRDALKDLLLRAWRLVAPAKLVAAYDAAEKG